ncbi:toxin biosynthesis [Pyrenophora seminiperda CCB06]|uniref:Toxin biosynthesis n=1 Tax=Pyrenophora seminiperda CCB06 TaxID=1302712 RepID=A0A3M7LVL1_9PLEO|nr:toxin biosynthesis [Pyrenophora seminiperda CCB06]
MTSILHAQANLITPVPSNINFYERTVGMFQFFMWQALAISLEDAVQGIWELGCARFGIDRQKGGVKLVEANIGRLWVCTSMWISMPWAADLTLRFRFGDALMVPFSLVGPWVGRALEAMRLEAMK